MNRSTYQDKNTKFTHKEAKIFDTDFDSIFQQFDLTPAVYKRMNVEKFAGMRVEG